MLLLEKGSQHFGGKRGLHVTRRVFSPIVLTIYNTATGEICSSDGPVFFSKIHFLTSSLVVLDFTINSNGFFDDSEIHLLIHKIHLEKSHFVWSFPRPFYACPSQHLSYVCGGFNTKTSPQNLHLFINCVTRESLLPRPIFFF